MADLTTLAAYKTLRGITSTDATRDASLTAWIAAVSADIQGRLSRTFGTGAETHVLDGPNSEALVLPTGPFTISTLQIWLNDDADGEAAAFTSDHALTMYDDFRADPDPTTPTVCTSRVVYRLGGAVWGLEARREVGRLANHLVPRGGSVKVTYTLADGVPADVAAAASDAVTLLYNGRNFGGPLTSESRGGYSYSRQSPAGGVSDAVDSVMPRLAKYARLERIIGWPTRGV